VVEIKFFPKQRTDAVKQPRKGGSLVQITMRNLSLLMLASLLGACDNPDSTSTSSLSGTVLGGQAPIVGSAVQLMAVGTPPAPATVLASATTDANGNFHLGPPNCVSPDQQLYLTATGGNPGGGANSAINLLTIVGPCGDALRSYTINELTTVAAVYSANHFIGPTGCVDCAAGSPADVDNISGSSPGLPNAFSTAPRLVDPARGTLAALPDATSCGASPPAINCTTSRKLGSLANALAACVNTSGPTSSQCVQLFNCSVPGASAASTTACNIPAGTTAPTDTLSALLSIARNPVTVAKAGIYYTATRNVVFSPAASSAPADWTLSRTLTGGGLNAPAGIAIDAQGFVWAADLSGNSLSKFGPDGVALSGSGYTGGGLNSPYAVAVDPNGNIWVSNDVGPASGASLSEFGSNGVPITSSSGYTGGGLADPTGIAFDTAGNAWVGNGGASNLSEFTASGNPVGSGYSGSGASDPLAVAISSTGNIWFDNSSNVLGEFNSAGAPIPVNGYPVSGLTTAVGVAIDPNDNVWVASFNNTLFKVSDSGTVLSGPSGFTGGGMNGSRWLAIDASGNVWVSSSGGGVISEFNSSGTALSPSSGFSSDGAVGGFGIAVDASGNVWSSNTNSNSLTELIGAAAPTRTPLVSTLSMGFQP
jgi:streptogramin lyase